MAESLEPGIARRLFESAPYGFYLLDLDGEVRAVNALGATHLGRPEQEIIGCRLMDFYARDVAEQRFAMWQEARRTGSVATFEDREGDRWYLTTVTPVPDDQGEVRYLAIHRVDISATKRAEELLCAQRDLAVALASSPGLRETLRLCLTTAIGLAGMDSGGVYLIDPDTGSLDLQEHHGLGERFLAGAQHYPAGSTNVQLIVAGRPLYSTFGTLGSSPDMNRDESLRALAILPFHHEGKVIGCLNLSSHSSDDVPHDARASVETIAAQIGSAIARSRAEHALRISEDKYRTLFAEALDGIVIADARTDVVLDCNRAALGILGRPREEVIGVSQNECLPPEFRDNAHAFLRFEVGENAWVGETQVVTKDGQRRDVSFKSCRIELGDRQVLQSHFRDITASKTMEAQLLQSQKMEAIGRLAGGIAHDFNNLLTGIQGNTSLLRLDALAGQHERLGSIEECVRSGAALTRQLLAFARGGRHEVKTIDLNRVADRSLVLLSHTSKNVGVRKQLAPDLWPIEADQDQMEQVLVNLCVNACQAMPDGGKLTVRTANAMLDKSFVAPHGVAEGPFVKLSVADTGVGMDEATRRRIFEPFFTTKEHAQGTGLGLATVYGIVKTHQGFIVVQSKPGGGSTFTIYLPASSRALVTEPSRAVEHLPGTGTILLVDDEAAVRLVMTTMLDALGYKVIAAKEGLEAIRLFEEHRATVDLIVLDMILPGVGGAAVLDRILELDPDARIILSTGYSPEGEAQAVVSRGCKGFLQKPFTLQELSLCVRDALRSD